MQRLLLLTAVGLLVAPAFAGSEILPIDGVGYLSYNVQTGKVTSGTASPRGGAPIWDCGGWAYVNYFWGADPFAGEAGLDWGDIAGPVNVGGLGFAEFTNSQAADGDLYGIVAIYTEENGWDSAGRVYVVGFLIGNIPGSTHPVNEYWGYIWGVEPLDPFVLDGSDLDGDGLTDWGYFQFYSGRTPGCVHGPAVYGPIDPNSPPPECPGAENAFDLFADPNWNNGPNNLDPGNIGSAYVGTYSFNDPRVFAQFYFALYAPSCPNQGESGRYCCADIDGSFDCIVGLADLSQLLLHYGMTTGATLLDGDVDPYDESDPGDGDVDLADLAELLSQYGDDCNWP